MSRHKKTREQKIIAGLRLKLQQKQAFSLTKTRQNPSSFSSSNRLPADKVAAIDMPPQLKQELLKTTFLTGAIIAIEFLLLFLFKKQIIVMPTISF